MPAEDGYDIDSALFDFDPVATQTAALLAMDAVDDPLETEDVEAGWCILDEHDTSSKSQI